MKGQESLRGNIIALRQAGYGIKPIARKLGIDPRTVRKWLRRDKETGDLSDLRRKPRNRVTTPEEDRQIIEAVKNGENPVTNAVKLREVLQLNVSVDTIRNRLHEANVQWKAPATKK